MGVTHGPNGPLNLTKTGHRKWVKSLLTKTLKGRALFTRMAEYIECDVLFENPDKIHAARLIVWWAATSKPQVKMDDMMWFKPYMKFTKYDIWDTKDAYGDAAPYARVLSVKMNLK